MYDEEDIRKANRSCRDNGAIGHSPVIAQIIELFNPDNAGTILDFGAGKTAKQAKDLRKKGFNVVAHEFGANFDPEVHDAKALSRTYDIVYASNVLNVQSTGVMLEKTIRQIALVTALVTGSRFYCNYPRQPRYLPQISERDLQRRLRVWWAQVEKLDFPYSGVIFECRW